MTEGAAGRPTLPVVRTVVDGCWWAVWHLRTSIAIALAWATVVAFLSWFLGRLPMRIPGLPQDAWGIEVAANAAPDLAVFATTLLGAAVIAVAAYRAVILDEPTDWRRALRPGRRELRVFGLSILVYVAAVAEVLLLSLALPLIAVAEPAGAPSPAHGLPVLIIATLLWSLLVAATLTPFIGFVFPLAAIDAPPESFHRSFRDGPRLPCASGQHCLHSRCALGARLPHPRATVGTQPQPGPGQPAYGFIDLHHSAIDSVRRDGLRQGVRRHLRPAA